MKNKRFKTLGLIPALHGTHKPQPNNVMPVNGHPLLAYTIRAALNSKVFSTVIVSTNSESYADIARYYGAEVPVLISEEMVFAEAPDFAWVQHMVKCLQKVGRHYDCFSILKPTFPFRTQETIQRAWRQFCAADGVDTLRAVEKCKQHPGKMWVIRDHRMMPLLPWSAQNESRHQPWHNAQYESLPEVFIQNASLDLSWCRVLERGSITGQSIMPFYTKNHEGLDLNDSEDCWYMDYLLASGQAAMPRIDLKPYEKISLNENHRISLSD